MSIVLAWAMGNAQAIIVAAIVKWDENALLIQALIALLALIASIVGAYVFGANWDDRDKRRHLADRDDFNPYTAQGFRPGEPGSAPG
ncbi:hypothetical protein [Ancylobacter sp. FA202]|uniref:hypothetical protein n=1 Tax=Ancylobacter sp. FA202 TaxID=1111106 RepID=UPI00039A4BE6|nr:hypothetical protein [Ancylobacter sp. FA202]